MIHGFFRREAVLMVGVLASTVTKKSFAQLPALRLAVSKFDAPWLWPQGIVRFSFNATLLLQEI